MLKWKRILALVLVLTLVCTNVPWTAAATALVQDGEEEVLTEQTVLPEELEKVEQTVTSVPAATGVSSGDYTEEVRITAPDYQVGDTIPAPQNIQIEVEGGTVKEIQGFTNADGTVFEANAEYYLHVTIEAPEGKPYRQGYTWIDCAHSPGWNYSDDYTQLYVDLQYDFYPPSVDTLYLNGLPDEIQAGTAPAVDIAVEGNAQLSGTRWLDMNGQSVSAFIDGNDYLLEMSFTANEGYTFRGYQSVYDNNAECELEFEIVDSDTLLVYRAYSLKPDAGLVQVTVTGVQVGSPVDAVQVSVGDNAVVSSVWVLDSETWETVQTGNYQENKTYRIGMELYPAEGYSFSHETPITVAESDLIDGWHHIYQGTYISMFVDFDFRRPAVNDLYMNGIPESVEPGAAVTLDLHLEGNAEITDIRWVDAEKNPVTVLELGNVYFLEVALAPSNGYVFRDYVNLDCYDFEIAGEEQLLAFWRFPVLPDTGRVDLTVSGVEIGAPVSGLTYAVDGNAVFQEFYITSSESDEPVTEGVFEDGVFYQVGILLYPADGYRFTEENRPYVNGTQDYGWNIDDDYAWVYLNYDFRDPPVEELDIDGLPDQIVPGTAQLPALSVDGNAQITGKRWLDADKQPVTSFVEGRNYYLEITLKPETGYAFYDRIMINNWDLEDYEIVSENELVVYCRYSLIPDAGTIVLNVSGLELGAPIDGVNVGVDGNASLEYIFIYNSTIDQKVETGNFLKDNVYDIEISLIAADGYRFTDDTELLAEELNQHGWGISADGTHMYIHTNYDFRAPAVGDLYIEGLPDRYDMVPGAAVLPQLTVEGDASIKNMQWVNADKQSVTTFAAGQDYYLKLTLEPKNGYVFRDYLGIQNFINVDDYTIVSENEATVYLYYSLKPDAGIINLTTVGIGAGKPASGVSGTVDGNAKLVAVEIWNDNTGEQVLGNMVNGQFYGVRYELVPADGYRFGNDTTVFVNGKNNVEYDTYPDAVYVYHYFNTCQTINTVALNVGKVEVGKNVADATVTAPANAHYIVENFVWIDHTEGWQPATGKFQKGHKYHVEFQIRPADGYAFSTDLLFTLGGKELNYSHVSSSGAYGYGEQVFSFLEKITKVELPAMPTSIKKGNTLPADFEVSSSAKYTLEAYWAIMEEGPVTKADKNASYVLVFYAEPKVGYEFADDTAVYVGGKKLANVTVSEDSVQVMKVYNVGITELDRIDVSAPAPEAGKAPSTVSVSDSAKYALLETAWGQSTDGDPWGSYDSVDVFAEGKYVMLAVALQSDSGNGFANEVDFYVNGKKMTSVACINYGTVLVCVVNLGKLGEVEPMDAPTVKAEGQTLTWQADPNATGYEIYRATSKSGKYSKVDTVAQTVWQDATATVGKTYYYKIKAVNAGNSDLNSGYSNIVSMAAKCAAPMIEVHIESAGGKPVVSWNKVTGAKKYEVYRATSVDGKYSKLTTTTKLTYTDTKAGVGIEYYYKVKAIASSSKYNSEYSGIWMSYAICARPTVTVKLDADTGKPSLSWKQVTGAKSYQVLRQAAGTEEFIPIAVCEKTAYLDLSAVIDTRYTYKVQALGEYNEVNSAYSDAVEETCALARPAFTADVNDNGKPIIQWDPVEGAVSYNIYRSTKSNKSYKLVHTTTDITYVDESVAAGKTYYYKLEAVGENSKSAQTAYVKLTGKCGIPELNVQAGSTGKPVLTWNKIAGAKKYEIWRSVDGAAFKKLTTTTKTTYTDSKATNGAECTYKVKALGSKSSYNGLFSEELGCYVTCAAPSLTAKVDTATGKPSLSWKKVTGAESYAIYRSENGGEYALLSTTTATSYLDEVTETDNKYTYYVVTVGKAEVFNSVKSAEKTVTVTVGQPKLTGNINEQGKAVITWQAVEDAVKYEVYRSTSSSKSYKLMTTITVTDPVTALSYTDIGITAGKTYYYKVTAVGRNSESTSAYVKLTGKCAQPEMAVTISEASGKPVITWNKISGAKKYELYRSTDGVKFSKLTTTTKTTYTDTKAAVGTEYTYKVRAVGSKSSYNSIYSAEQKAISVCAKPVVTLKIDSATGKPTLSWKAVTGAIKYGIYFDDGESYYQISETEKTTFTHMDAYPGKVCCYHVVAYGTSHAYDSARTITGTVTATCATPKPTGKTALNGKPQLTWEAVEDATVYVIYRSTSSSKNYTAIDTTESLTYTDISAVKNKTYYYKVAAVAGDAESTQSSYVKLKCVASKRPTSFSTSKDTGKSTVWDYGPIGVNGADASTYTYAELEAMAKQEARAIADYIEAYPGLTLDIDRIALAAKIINTLYVAEGKGASFYDIVDGEIIEIKIPGYNQPYGTLVTFRSTCAGDVRALGMVLEYLGYDWYHVNENKWEHQWCVVYDVDGQTAWADGSMYGIAGYGERATDGSNWLQFSGPLIPIE